MRLSYYFLLGMKWVSFLAFRSWFNTWDEQPHPKSAGYQISIKLKDRLSAYTETSAEEQAFCGDQSHMRRI